MITWLTSLKLTLTQWLLASAALLVAGMAALLVFYRRELQQTRVNLLAAHFENTQQQFDNKLEAAHDKVVTSKEKYEKALSDYHNS